MHSYRTVHLVGSIRLPTEPEDPLSNPPPPSAIFETISAALPGRLRRIPDGETGERHYFVNWQIRAFEPSPWLLNHPERKKRSVVVPDNPEALEINLGTLGYDEVAIKSFEAFERLQKEGVIEPGVRFQVCIPTPIQPICRYVRPEFRAKVEPIYEELLRGSIARIQAHIPPGKLAFQFDCAMEFAMLEGVPGPGGGFTPWFEPSPSNLVERAVRIAEAVHRDAEVGFHLCYGDLQHRHFVEPRDTTRLVEMANLLSVRAARRIDFFHLPIPKDRKDEAYFAPLRELCLPTGTEVMLGVVHAHDLVGTRQRIAAAERVLQRFGIATECGWGRTPVGDIESILAILREVSASDEET